MSLTNQEFNRRKDELPAYTRKALETWSPRTQRRWIANPFVEYIMQTTIRELLASVPNIVTPKRKGLSNKKPDPSKLARETFSEAEEPMFSLFDDEAPRKKEDTSDEEQCLACLTRFLTLCARNPKILAVRS